MELKVVKIGYGGYALVVEAGDGAYFTLGKYTRLANAKRAWAAYEGKNDVYGRFCYVYPAV